LGGAVLGAYLDGLTGLSLGWFVAVCIEAVFMFRTVYRAAWLINVSTGADELRQSAPYQNSQSIIDTLANKSGLGL